jgi:cellulose synthase/poly-beta-1,6-N-acetylglucosamine synthase-like glycosyltransferase
VVIVLLFWCAFALIAYAYLGYPVLVSLLSRYRARPWAQKCVFPKVSIIMAVHNGAATLKEKIDHLLELDYPTELIELLVVSDGSTDGTNEILEKLTNPRVRTWILEGHRGKAVALNQAIRHANGEVLLFVDIRPRLERQALASLMRNFFDPKVGAVGGELFLRDGNHDASSAAVGNLYWRYEQWIRTCEAKVDSAIGLYGGFYAVRRALATELPAGTILDDMLQPLNVVRQGYRCVLDQGAKVWDTWPKAAGDEFRRKVRTLAGNFQLLQLAPWLLTSQNRVRFQLVSHKLLRLLVPFALITTLVTSGILAARPFYAAMFAIQALAFVLGLIGQKVSLGYLRGISGPASALLLLNVAAVVGLYRYITKGNDLWRIWVSPGANANTSATTPSRGSQ